MSLRSAYVSQRQRDPTDWAGVGAAPVADAARAVHDQRLAVDDLEHALLGASRHAQAAPDAAREVDVWELQARFVRPRAFAVLRSSSECDMATRSRRRAKTASESAAIKSPKNNQLTAKTNLRRRRLRFSVSNAVPTRNECRVRHRVGGLFSTRAAALVPRLRARNPQQAQRTSVHHAARQRSSNASAR